MSPLSPRPNPSDRQKAWSRVRTLTRAAVLAATGLTAFIGVAVAKEHGGSSGTATASGGAVSGTGATTTTTPSSSDDSDNTGSTGSTGNTGNTGSTSSGVTSPSISSNPPAVTSGGSSR